MGMRPCVGIRLSPIRRMSDKYASVVIMMTPTVLETDITAACSRMLHLMAQGERGVVGVRPAGLHNPARLAR